MNLGIRCIRIRSLSCKEYKQENKQENKTEIKVQIGQMIVYPKEMEEPDCLPFGIGRITEIKKDCVQIHRHGNAQYHPKGYFWPGWIDPKD